MDKTNIKEFLDSPAGANMKELLQSKLNELDSVKSLRDLDNPEEMAVEVKAHKKAVEILEEIFSEIGTFSSTPKGRSKKDSYHVE